jgi:hypothetical protein
MIRAQMMKVVFHVEQAHLFTCNGHNALRPMWPLNRKDQVETALLPFSQEWQLMRDPTKALYVRAASANACARPVPPCRLSAHAVRCPSVRPPQTHHPVVNNVTVRCKTPPRTSP